MAGQIDHVFHDTHGTRDIMNQQNALLLPYSDDGIIKSCYDIFTSDDLTIDDTGSNRDRNCVNKLPANP